MDYRVKEVIDILFNPTEKELAIYLLEHPDVDRVEVYNPPCGSLHAVKYSKQPGGAFVRTHTGKNVDTRGIDLEWRGSGKALASMDRRDLASRVFRFYAVCKDKEICLFPSQTLEFVEQELLDLLQTDTRSVKVQDLRPGMLVYVTSRSKDSDIKQLLCEVVDDCSVFPNRRLLITNIKEPNFVVVGFPKEADYKDIDWVNSAFTFELLEQ